MTAPLDSGDPLPVVPPDPVARAQRMGANSTPQLAAASAPNSLPVAQARPLPDATSNHHWPRADVTLPAPGPDPASRAGHRTGLNAGQVALLLLACGGVALLVAVIIGLRDNDPYRAVLGGGAAFIAMIPVAFTIVSAMRNQ
jgi:hypothetical protein